MDDTLNEDCFYRIHKSFIVNIDFVAKVMKGTGGEVVMQDGTKIPIARRKKDRLMELIGI